MYSVFFNNHWRAGGEGAKEEETKIGNKQEVDMFC